jgi:hypothetical protein
LVIHKPQKKGFLLLALLVTSMFIAASLVLPNSKFVALGDAGTQVGGTLASNVTWTAVGSPYVVVSTVQVPENITLTVEPGVTVIAQSSVASMFLINGAIIAHGTSVNKIIFEGNGNCNFFKTNHPVAKGFADLDYCIIRNGQSAFWFDNTGSFNLTNSELSDLSQNSYLWYPSQDTYIEFNTFTNTAGTKIGTDDYTSSSHGFVYVKCNLFTNNQGFAINNYASYGQSKTLVNNNSFAYTSGVVLEVEKSSTTADMNATGNYWGTTNTSIIETMIYDKNNDASCASYINYLPILDAPDPEAPIAPTPTPTPTATPTPTPTPTETPTPTPTLTPEPTTSPSPTPSPTSTATSSSTTSQTQTSSTNPDPTTSSGTSASTQTSIPEFPTMPLILIVLVAAMSVTALFFKRKTA